MSQISNGAFNALRRQLQQALETAEALRSELRGAVIVNWILTKRLGGEVTVTSKELTEMTEAFSFRSHYDVEQDAYVFTATMKAEETVPVPVDPEEWKGIEGSGPATL